MPDLGTSDGKFLNFFHFKIISFPTAFHNVFDFLFAERAPVPRSARSSVPVAYVPRSEALQGIFE